MKEEKDKKGEGDKKEEKKEEPKEEKKGRDQPKKPKEKEEKPAEKTTKKDDKPEEKPAEKEKPKQPSVRPTSSVKRPIKNESDTQVLVEETQKDKMKAPQGLISDNAKEEEQEEPMLKTKAPTKVDDDLGGAKTGNKLRIVGRIGHHDKLNQDNSPKAAKSTFNAADLDSIKNYVQDITKSSNPIGKIIDFLGDDIDSMNKELGSWIKESKNYKDRFDEEVKKSDETLLPLQNELLELEETIRDEYMRIKSIKSRMIKNEQIIQNLINNVISIKNEN